MNMRKLARTVVGHMNSIGANRRPMTMIVFLMGANPGLSYRDALAYWAEFEDEPTWDAHRWHTEICYWLMKDGQEVPSGVAAWFEEQAKEVRAIANGIPA